MNATGILTAAYQVLHLLPVVRYPPPPGSGLEGGYLRWGTPIQVWWGVPELDLAGVPPPHLDLAGIPPPPSPRCEQTENITFPHPSDAVGNNVWACLRDLIFSELPISPVLQAIPFYPLIQKYDGMPYCCIVLLQCIVYCQTAVLQQLTLSSSSKINVSKREKDVTDTTVKCELYKDALWNGVHSKNRRGFVCNKDKDWTKISCCKWVLVVIKHLVMCRSACGRPLFAQIKLFTIGTHCVWKQIAPNDGMPCSFLAEKMPPNLQVTGDGKHYQWIKSIDDESSSRCNEVFHGFPGKIEPVDLEPVDLNTIETESKFKADDKRWH